ncbi:FAD-binding protein [Thermodesulfobacteriota bacterium]
MSVDSSSKPTAQELIRPDMTTDVLIIGYGGAGATAAITAHDNGAEVTILEKMPDSGGNTRISAGVIMHPNKIEAVRYIEELCCGTTERDIIETYVQEAMGTKTWLEKLGGEVIIPKISRATVYPQMRRPCWPNVPGGEFIEMCRIKPDKSGPIGESLWRLLSNNVNLRKIKVINDTPVKELVTNRQGEVVGAIAERKGKKIKVAARKAVILTCGGFQNNEAMKQSFLSCRTSYSGGSRGNTGDGIVMAQKVGAEMWHMTAVAGSYGFRVPGRKASFYFILFGERFIYVDTDGKRFINEAGQESHNVWGPLTLFDPDRRCYPRIPCFAIFDDATRQKGPISISHIGANHDYKWSSDNSKEIANGWITKAETIGELSKKISIDEVSLEDTVQKYNAFCHAGKDTDFGRSRESLGPLENTPYYAIKLWPCLLNTEGGPRRDKDAKVINYEGNPIPRLYSAGELGSLWGGVYEGGANLAECIAFGRIAGRNAAAEQSL